MDRFQPIVDIAGLCSGKGISSAVLSPGSRCAPLTLAFVRHPKIQTRTISDERSAGFIALGIAQQTHQATVLLSTSGTAAYNFAPAVAEAFFSHTPLIVFTADRPEEWIGQQDGQTIYQQGLFGKHVKKSFQLLQEYEHPDNVWAINRTVNEAINLALQLPPGPVHINVPFREPLYPAAGEKFQLSKEIRILETHQAEPVLVDETKDQLKEEWKSFNNVLIIAGQQFDDQVTQVLMAAAEKHSLPVVGEILSNLHAFENLVRNTDLFLGQATDAVKKSLQPDLLITFGGAMISKNLKQFLRNFTGRAHWHVQPAGIPADTFQHLTKVIYTTPYNFFIFLNSLPASKSFEAQKQSNYKKLWEVEDRRVKRVMEKFFPRETFGELELVSEIIRQLPERCNLHLANSMSVRYANFIGLKAKQKRVRVFSNRGTSGIDGCTSTAVGHSLASDIPNILITGDMAFFYDRNAFWNNYPIPNLHIVVLNNHGGIIFSLIDGPSSLPEAGEYFITHQKLNARKLCEEFGFDYLKIDNKRKIKNTLRDFLDFEGTTKVLELESEIDVNKNLFDQLKQKIKKSYET